jgi:hypothetical protein
MKTIFLVAFLFSCAAYAAEPIVVLTPEQAKRKCDKDAEAAGNKAVAEAKLQHPDDAPIIKQREKQIAYHKCMRLEGYASGPIRTE